MSAPTPYQIETAMSALLSARQRLLAEDPEIAFDERLFSDMLEGETADAMQVLHRVLQAAVHAESMADAASEQMKDLGLRHARYVSRAKNLRGVAFAAMDALGLRRIELPELTASIAAGRPSLVVTDEAAIPEQYFRIHRDPDKSALTLAIKSGEEVPGVTLSNSLPNLQLRTK